MDDNSVIALLESITDPPEPSSRVDVNAARRRGRRRQRLWRAGAPALAVVAVAAAVTVPRALYSGAERTGVSTLQIISPSPSVSRPPMPASAPARFNVLVPYAAFGWLPAGYSAANIPLNTGGELNSGPTELDLTATSPHGGAVNLTVYAKGACTTASPCFTPTAAAPDVNGRPARWVNDGRRLAWEYAPDAWATVYDSPGPSATETGTGKAKLPRGAVKPGQLPVTTTSRDLLIRVASAVKYAQAKPLLFSFKLTSPLPAGWRLSEQSFHVVAGRLLADGLNAGPAADPSALSIGASAQFNACNYVDGQSSYVTRDGVNWEYRVLDDHIAKNVEMLCSTATVDGLQVNIYLDMAPEVAGAPPLPGSTQLGGAFGVYEKLRLLGPDPANWTTNPLP